MSVIIIMVTVMDKNFSVISWASHINTFSIVCGSLNQYKQKIIYCAKMISQTCGFHNAEIFKTINWISNIQSKITIEIFARTTILTMIHAWTILSIIRLTTSLQRPDFANLCIIVIKNQTFIFASFIE